MRLVIIQGPGSEAGQPPATFDLSSNTTQPVLRAGRHTSNDIILTDASVSRQHTEIQVHPNGLVVRDLGSSNGTFINRQRLDPQIPGFVKPGDQLRIGNVITLLEPDFAPGPRPNEPVNLPPLYPQAPVPEAFNRARPAKARSGGRWFLLGVLLGVMLLVLAVAGFWLTQNLNSSPPIASVVLPSSIFASPANSENALGVTLARPSAWQKNEAANGAQIIFARFGAATATITLEKPPGPVINNALLSPEAALRQYLANVQANSQAFQLLVGPAPTKLGDGTPGYFARLIFTPNANPTLVNYTLNTLTFKCGDSLYFASTGIEGKDYSGSNRQDLEAAIASFKC